MRRAHWMALSTLVVVAPLLSRSNPAQADSIPSYARIVDVGQLSNQTDTESPRIDNNGNVTHSVPLTVGAYTLGSVPDPLHYGQTLFNFLHRAGSDVNLLPPSLQGPEVNFQGVNALGYVVGDILGKGGHDFVYSAESGQIGQLKSLPGAWQTPSAGAINNLNQIVGESDGKAVFYASPTSSPVELSQLLPTSSGWKHLLDATGINDRGEIVGYGINPAGQGSDFKFEPSAVPEPSTLAIFAVAGLAFAMRQIVARPRKLTTPDRVIV